MMVPDKEYNCLTCPYPRYRTPELIYCDVCIRKIMDKHQAEQARKHDHCTQKATES